MSFQSILPRSTESRSDSMFAVNFVSTISANAMFITLLTASPSSVTNRFFFSFVAYLLPVIVPIVGAYVDGLPIPCSSIAFTRDASVYLAGGCVKCWFSLNSTNSSSDSLSSLATVLFVLIFLLSSSVYTFMKPSNFTFDVAALNS